MYEKGQRVELSIATWKAIYLGTDNPSVKEIAKRALANHGIDMPEKNGPLTK
ncbi:hypothetical protein D3C78_1684670 [compost metagenome]